MHHRSYRTFWRLYCVLLLFLLGLFGLRVFQWYQVRHAVLTWNRLVLDRSTTTHTELLEQALDAYQYALSTETRQLYQQKIQHNIDLVSALLADQTPSDSSHDAGNQFGDDDSESGENDTPWSSPQDDTSSSQDDPQGAQQGDQQLTDLDLWSSVQQPSDNQPISQTQPVWDDRSQPTDDGTIHHLDQVDQWWAEQWLSDELRTQLLHYQEFIQDQQGQFEDFFAPLPSTMHDDSVSLRDMFFDQPSQRFQQLPVYEWMKDW